MFFSYVIIYPGEETTATLYVDAPKVAKLHDYFAANKITVAPYEHITKDLEKLAAEKKRVGVDTKTCNAELYRLIKDSSVALSDNII